MNTRSRWLRRTMPWRERRHGLDVWNARLGDAKKLRSKLEVVVRQKQQRLDRIEDAFLHERSIDRQTYEHQRDKLREQLSLAEMELSDAVLDDLDVEGVLGFAEHVLTNAARLWAELGIDGKQELQQALFPEGVSFDGEEFGTAVTSLAFKHFEALRPTGNDLASPTGHALMWKPKIQGKAQIAA